MRGLPPHLSIADCGLRISDFGLRIAVSPPGHGGHGGFTEASEFSVHLRVLCGREKKCIAGFQPAKVVLTQKELSRLRCRRDAGATIFSHDLCLRGEQGAWILLELGFPQLAGLVMALRRVGLSYGLRSSAQSGRARA